MHFSLSRKKFSLQIHIIILFTILIIISGISLGWYSYSQLSQSMLNDGKSLFTKSSVKVVTRINRESDHIHTMLKILKASHITQLTSAQKKINVLPVLSEMLKNTPSLSALFVAYPNDDFFLYKKTPSSTVLKQYSAPENSYFMLTLRQSGETKHRFYDQQSQLLKIVADSDYNLQISQRPWYQTAKNSEKYIITEAYLFHASQEFGVTLAVEDKDNGAVIGADYTLSNLSKLLQEFKAYPSSQRIVVDQAGQVIAYQDTEKLLSKNGKFNKFKSVESLELPVLAHMFEHYKGQKGSILFSFNGEDWLGKVSAVSAKGNLLLFQVVKTKELLSDAYKLRYKSMLITLLIILTTLPIAWYFARLLTAPISGLTKELEKIKDFDFSQSINSKTPIKEIADLIAVTNSMKETISHFQDLSASLVSKQSYQQLLTKISLECNNIPNSQGTIILLNERNKCAIKHCHLIALDNAENEQLQLQLSKSTFSCTELERGIHNQILPAELNEIISHHPKMAATQHWKLVPMKNRDGQNLGVIAVLESQQAPLNEGKLQYAQAIASFSALSIQSQQLLSEQKQLLESFILLIAGAIDSKSPYTGGHCARVPELTKMLSKAACDDQQGNYKNFELSEDQWEELHIAAWLHDCGKIVTPEYVVDKATKLETIYDRLNEVRMRFELLKNEAHKNYWQGLAEQGDKQQLTSQRDQLLKQLDEEFEFVAECNIGGEFMSDDKIERLQEIAKRTWTRTLSNKIGIAPHQTAKIAECTLPTQEHLLVDKVEHLIEREHAELTEAGNQWNFDMQTPEYRFNRGELYNLSVKRGTLTDEDRFIINGHMVHTIVMLSKLPFPDHLQQVPIIAGGHHEKMDGTGYPRKVNAGELPTTARIMVIADIFEALTASDRPYKERKTLSQSIKIMSFMVKDDHIDGELFKLFLTSGVYMQYAKAYLMEDQIDDLDINQYL
ncbi:HD domain-containing phosphohydrolase [Psychromonas sp. Urea-02u-13]|uniref:HD domain-containing phosphohydrolase n=1 Tax=Psychromonas sp. Urea-02u-13 TaxID=2058326 RepID=UPI000C31D90A|nr:HD domain-containing phosphohydrolase [Psychromonas sp. Urea-02u-13]PKG40552.1 metal-dependent phosphohydrolase [Psychromonas sp. Urea-02u-13]